METGHPWHRPFRNATDGSLRCTRKDASRLARERATGGIAVNHCPVIDRELLRGYYRDRAQRNSYDMCRLRVLKRCRSGGLAGVCHRCRGVVGGMDRQAATVKSDGQERRSRATVKSKVKSKVKSATASLREALRGGLASLARLVGRLAVCFLGAVLFPSVAASALRVQHAARGANFNPLR